MIQLRALILTSLMLPWILSSAAKYEYMEARKAEIDSLNIPDYGMLQDSESEVATNVEDMPTCLLCVCLSGSVYCEEVSPEMSIVPALPRETAYFYARFNKITKISNKDFADMATLRRIDLSGNQITDIEDAAFSKLTNLEELNLAENRLTRLPILPNKLITFNGNFNRLTTQGVKATAFKKLTKLAYLYLGNNELTAVPQLPESLQVVHLNNNRIRTITDQTICKGNTSFYIRPNMDQVRLDGNPIVLSNYPDSFICLRALPIGSYK
ncbi:osteoglycin, paralog b isoform X1 [Sphaeramia orbicularis]|uniref:Mimecan n=2 Tax=Sphaeramia orbicularis TaxID=375764 RepID=A0A673A3G7_9TELE|nr:mimecan-like isoform X1 [Sphaeramia orbicularis]XP_029994012.1 mimecan-like isoform X1 [Sphaeramia orbicularis]